MIIDTDRHDESAYGKKNEGNHEGYGFSRGRYYAGGCSIEGHGNGSGEASYSGSGSWNGEGSGHGLVIRQIKQ